ncbi:ATP-binding cassette domain-containing protein [Streptacidiphilus sp. EB129]|uniref:ATP-binding cassette domain-containing protein n=1 Tax=Streptacidiphilus sp. EB129 TaxID=3156262 RepID=UPI003510E430
MGADQPDAEPHTAPDAAPYADPDTEPDAVPMAEPTEALRGRRGDRLLRQCTRAGAVPTAALLLSVVVSTTAAVLLPAALARAVDAGLSGSRNDAVPVFLTLLGVLTAAETLTQFAEPWCAAHNTGYLSRRLIRHCLAIGVPGTHRYTTGDLVGRLVTSAPEAGAASAALGYAAVQTAGSLGAVVALALIDPWLAVVVLLGAPLGFVMVRLFVRRASLVATDYQRAQAALVNRLLDALAGIRTINASGTRDREVERVLAPLPELNRAGRALWESQRTVLWRTGLLLPILQITVLSVAGAEVGAGQVSPGQLLAAVGYTTLALGFLGSAQSLLALARARAGAVRIADVLAHPTMVPGDRPLSEGPGELVVEDVTVRLGSTPVLRGLSLRVPAGTSVALVGRTGAGKSTLAAVIGRLIDPDEGRVLLDGVPLRDLHPHDLRRAVTYAFAQPVLLGDTVGDALAFGGPPTPDAARVREAARTADADTFVARLPHGYDTPLRRAPMSAGQAQRLGLARAIAHAGRLLILDDATSSLDTATEARVSTALRRALPGRTRVLIAHRVTTAADADLVAWLADGRLRALAPHRTLWADPSYRALFSPHPADGTAALTAPDSTDPDSTDPDTTETGAIPPRHASARSE